MDHNIMVPGYKSFFLEWLQAPWDFLTQITEFSATRLSTRLGNRTSWSSSVGSLVHFLHSSSYLWSYPGGLALKFPIPLSPSTRNLKFIVTRPILQHVFDSTVTDFRNARPIWNQHGRSRVAGMLPLPLHVAFA